MYIHFIQTKNEDSREKQLSPEQLHVTVEKSLSSSIYDGAFYSVMQGITSSFLVPYAIFLHAPTILLGILNTLPELFGAVLQFFTKKIFFLFSSRKKVIVVLAFLQALLWLPLLFLPTFQLLHPSYVLLVFLCLIGLCSAVISPLWNALMLDLVPEHHRGSYFGKRNMITAVAAFLATLVGGFILNYFSVTNKLLGFSVLFIIAAFSRLLSTLFLLQLYEPETIPQRRFSFNQEVISFFSFVQHIHKESFGRFVLFISFFKFAVFIASPFFAVYMLQVLHFSYFQFTLITLASVITSILGMKIFGKYSDSSGTKNVLLLCGFLIPLVPFFWLFTTNFYLLFVIEAFAGFVWAGFNLSTSNYLYDCSTKNDISDHVSNFNLFHTLFLVLGSLFGGLLIDYLPFNSLQKNILAVFLISALLRLFVALIFIPILKEMRLIEIPLEKGFFGKFVAVKHVQGVVYETMGHYDKTVQLKKIDPTLLLHEQRHKLFEQQQRQQQLLQVSVAPKVVVKDKEYYAKKSIENLLKNVKKK